MGFLNRNKNKEVKKNKTAKSTITDSKKTETKTDSKKTEKTSKSPAKPEVEKIQIDKKDKTKTASSNNLSNQKTPTNTYYLTIRVKNNKKVGWEIKRGNAAKVSVIVPTKEAAKLKVKELAKNSNANVIVYRVNGTIEETYRINDK